MTVGVVVKFSDGTRNDVLSKAAKAFPKVEGTPRFFSGSDIKNQEEVYILAEWETAQLNASSQSNAEIDSFLKQVREVCGEPGKAYTVTFAGSALTTPGTAQGDVLEFVQSYFPASRVTPEFQTQVVEDFQRFEEIYKRETKGDLSLAYGWVDGEEQHAEIQGEKAKSFLVVREWESMGDFNQSVSTKAFQEAIPILLAWKSAYKMWHVSRNV